MTVPVIGGRPKDKPNKNMRKGEMAKVKEMTERRRSSGGNSYLVINDKFVLRSTMYNPAYPQMMVDWFSKDDNYIKVRGKKEANDYMTYEGFAANIGVDIKTLNRWTKNYEEMAIAKSICDSKRKDRLLVNGLNGTYNPTIVKLVAQNEFGMSDKVESTVVSEPTEDQKRSMIKEYLDSMKNGEILDVSNTKGQ